MEKITITQVLGFISMWAVGGFGICFMLGHMPSTPKPTVASPEVREAVLGAFMQAMTPEIQREKEKEAAWLRDHPF